MRPKYRECRCTWQILSASALSRSRDASVMWWWRQQALSRQVDLERGKAWRHIPRTLFPHNHWSHDDQAAQTTMHEVGCDTQCGENFHFLETVQVFLDTHHKLMMNPACLWVLLQRAVQSLVTTQASSLPTKQLRRGVQNVCLCAYFSKGLLPNNLLANDCSAAKLSWWFTTQYSLPHANRHLSNPYAFP